MPRALPLLLAGAFGLAACSPANGKEVRVFSSEAQSQEDSWEEEPGPDGEGGGEPWPDGQGGAPSAGGQGDAGTSGAGGLPQGAGGAPANTGGSNQGGNPSYGGAPGSGGSPPGGNAGASGASGAGGQPCTYPSGGFGTSAGNVVAPSVSWDGFGPGSSSSSSISVQSFYDCDGTKGVNALLLIYGAGWCTACQEEAALLPDLMQTWGPAGIVVLELIVETSGGSPATSQTAKQWRDAFQLESVYVAADPSFQLQSAAADSFPYKVLVDPRTMTIVTTYTGGTNDDAVMQLAVKNQ